jgi:general secretion pathway protein L
MLAEFFEWWTRQWLALLPLSSRFNAAGQASGMTIGLQSAGDHLNNMMEIAGDGREAVVLPFNSEGLATLRAMPGAKRSPLRLILPAGTILERKVSLPVAVERDLAQVLHYEMNRLTPFASADVFWDWILAGQDKRLGKLDIRLRLAKRDKIAPILDALQNHGLHPDYLESRGADAGAPLRKIRLTQEKASRSIRSPVRVAALAVCGVLFLALCATPFVRQQIELSAVGRQIAALQPSVAAAAALRRSIEADAESNVILHVERDLAGDPLQTLAAVTDALPDGTWLTDLTLQQRVLHMGGESHAAAQLIGKLAAVSLIGDPAFAAPVTSDTDRHTDIFAISAEIRP